MLVGADAPHRCRPLGVAGQHTGADQVVQRLRHRGTLGEVGAPGDGPAAAVQVTGQRCDGGTTSSRVRARSSPSIATHTAAVAVTGVAWLRRWQISSAMRSTTCRSLSPSARNAPIRSYRGTGDPKLM